MKFTCELKMQPCVFLYWFVLRKIVYQLLTQLVSMNIISIQASNKQIGWTIAVSIVTDNMQAMFTVDRLQRVKRVA